MYVPALVNVTVKLVVTSPELFARRTPFSSNRSIASTKLLLPVRSAPRTQTTSPASTVNRAASISPAVEIVPSSVAPFSSVPRHGLFVVNACPPSSQIADSE